MRRIITVCIVAMLLMTTKSVAQDSYTVGDVGNVEVELSVGLATAANKMPEYGRSRQGVDASVEVRYNFDAQPVDLGLYVSVCSLYRGETKNNIIRGYNFISENLLITSDYNFLQGSSVSPFVGLGMGVAWGDVRVKGSAHAVNHGAHFAVMPRVGVELSHHVRITVAYKLFNREHNHLLISLGYAFGGGRR